VVSVRRLPCGAYSAVFDFSFVNGLSSLSVTIAVIMPNDQSVDYDWAKFRVSVADVEKLTGFKFWPAIPEDTARALKISADEVKVKTPRPGKEPE
jgi:DNA/RNA endonuclease G (NUC1)